MSAFAYNDIDLGGANYGLVVLTQNAPGYPEPRLIVEPLAQADGAVSWGGFVGPREWRLRCMIAGNAVQRLNRWRNVVGVLSESSSGEKPFVMDSEPDREYQVRLASGLDGEAAVAGLEFTLRFVAPNPDYAPL